MNILHVIGGDIREGAARGAYWLHQALRSIGVESTVLTNSRILFDDPSLISIQKTKKGKAFNLFREQLDQLPILFYKNRKKNIFSTGFAGFDFTKTDSYNHADIIHLHWINSGLVNVRDLKKIQKPLVWSMRDMWPMTGGCHYSMACDGYLSRCGKCPQLGSHREKDLSRMVWNRKDVCIPKNTKIIGISLWLSNLARRSSLFRNFDIRTIPNNINTRDFFPVSKLVARQALGLPQNRPVILAGAQTLDDFYKRFDLFLQAISHLDKTPLLLFFGRLNPALLEPLSRDHISLGLLNDKVSLRLVYSAADVFVASSQMDAFGKTLAESMSCGTPVVCFDASGPKDIVDHKESGYKAQPFDPKDLARGIEWVLTHPEPQTLSRKARDKVLQEFDSDVIAKKYMDLYAEILNQ